MAEHTWYQRNVAAMEAQAHRLRGIDEKLGCLGFVALIGVVLLALILWRVW